ncbi:MAG: histidine phosphatase family protein [Lapillicoccus sp.]
MTDPEPRRVIVLRHGRTDDNAANVWQGHRDTVLSAIGREQATATAPVLAAYRPSVIVSSDLRRAADTARAVAELVGVPVRLDSRFREVHVGQWQGMSHAVVQARYGGVLEAIDRGDDVRKGVTGETRAELAVRVTEALDELVGGLGSGQTALVVAHGVSGRVAAAALVGLDQGVADEVLRGLDNCHWAELVEVRRTFSADVPPVWRIAAWNRGAASPP